MDIRTQGSSLMVSAKNFVEFNDLLERAQKEAQQLNETLRKLSCFEFDFQVSVQNSQAGDMVAASSAISTMPTK